jgi:hypothetical protein
MRNAEWEIRNPKSKISATVHGGSAKKFGGQNPKCISGFAVRRLSWRW